MNSYIISYNKFNIQKIKNKYLFKRKLIDIFYFQIYHRNNIF
jgi:hypothetical protein